MYDYDRATAEARAHTRETGHAVGFDFGGWHCDEPDSDCEARGPTDASGRGATTTREDTR
jgi:hypothetical protein